MQLPFIFFGQHTKYTYAALEYLSDHGIFPRLIVVNLPKTKTKRLDPLYYYHYSHGEKVDPSVFRGAFDLRHLASKNCCDVIETEDANNPAVLAHLVGQRPQFFLTVGFSHLFSTNLLNIPPMGALNIHPSLLPQMRGPVPFFWIWRKCQWDAAGVTLHYMNERADRGNILAQQPIVVSKEMDIFDYLYTAGQYGAQLFYQFIQKGSFPAGTPQDGMKGSWAPRPQFNDLAINPTEVTIDQLEWMLKGLSAAYQLHVNLGVDCYYFTSFLEGRTDMNLAGQYLLKGDTLYLPVKDGMAICKVSD